MSVNDSISYPHAKITYPIEFAHFANPFATITVADSTNDLGAGECSIPRKSLTDFYFAMEGMSDSGGQKGCTWMAIGYQLNGLLTQWMKIMSATGSGQKKIEKNFVINFSQTPVVTVGRSEDNQDSDYSYCWLEKFTESSVNILYNAAGTKNDNNLVMVIATGYQSNGLIRQWGTQKATGSQVSTVSFYVPFSNENSYYINFITQRDIDDDYYVHRVSNKNGSSCTVHDYNINNSNFFDWFATGY